MHKLTRLFFTLALGTVFGTLTGCDKRTDAPSSEADLSRGGDADSSSTSLVSSHPEDASHHVTDSHGQRSINSHAYALLIGNKDYESAQRLKNPINDVTDVGDALRRAGWQVRVEANLNNLGMRRVIREFIRDSAGAKQILFFYAGHAIENDYTGLNQNYLMPVDARLDAPDELPIQTIPLQDLLAQLNAGELGLKIVVLDSCRDNPFKGREREWMRKRSAQVGLGPVMAEQLPRGTLIVFSAGPGMLAADGVGRNSPFATEWLRHMNPGRSVLDVFTDVGVAMAHQEPYFRIDESAKAIAAFRESVIVPTNSIPVRQEGSNALESRPTGGLEQASNLLEQSRRQHWKSTPQAHTRGRELASQAIEIARRIPGAQSKYLMARAMNIIAVCGKSPLADKEQDKKTLDEASALFDEICQAPDAPAEWGFWWVATKMNARYNYDPETSGRSASNGMVEAALAKAKNRWPDSSAIAAATLHWETAVALDEKAPVLRLNALRKVRLPKSDPLNPELGRTRASYLQSLIGENLLFASTDGDAAKLAAAEMVSLTGDYLVEFRRGVAGPEADRWKTGEIIQALRFLLRACEVTKSETGYDALSEFYPLIQKPEEDYSGADTLELLATMSRAFLDKALYANALDAANRCLSFAEPISGKYPLLLFANAPKDTARKVLEEIHRLQGDSAKALFYLTERVDYAAFLAREPRPAWLTHGDYSSVKEKAEAYIASKLSYRRIVISLDVGGQPVPVQFEVCAGPLGLEFLMEQVRWIRHTKGVVVPDKLIERFQQLSSDAEKKGVDFRELVNLAIDE